MTDDDAGLRRLRWRCRRGMRELDELLMAYINKEYVAASTERQAAFAALLTLQDPEILALLTEKTEADDPELHALIQQLLGRSGAAL